MIGALSSVDRASSSGEELRLPGRVDLGVRERLAGCSSHGQLGPENGNVRREEVVTLLETSRGGKHGADAHDDLTRRGTFILDAERPGRGHPAGPQA